MIDTIKALLTKANVSNELADQICESMEQYKAKVNEQAKAEITNKVKAVKAIVLEEVESYKTDLAKRVQLFCESKSQTIEQQLMRKSAAGEAEATTRLKKVHALLEGVELDGKPNSEIMAQLASAQEKIGKMTQKIKVTEAKAQRSLAVAESVLAKNKTLINENKKLKDGQMLVSENTIAKATSIDKSTLIVPPKTKQNMSVIKPTVAPITESTKPVDPIAAIAESM